MARIKVAFFGNDFSRHGKGTALVVQQLAKQFIENFSDQIDLAIISEEGKCNHKVCVNVRHFQIKKYRLPIFSTIFSYFIFFLGNLEQFDVVIFNRMVYPGFWFLNSKKFVLFLHDAPENSVYKERLNLENRCFGLFLRHCAKYFLHAIIAVSEAARKGIIKYYGLSEDQTFFVYNGVSRAFYPLAPEEKKDVAQSLWAVYGIRPPYILSVARLEPHKNIEKLIEAFSILKREHQIDHKLVIVGTRHFAGYAAMIDEIVIRCGLKDEVVFIPYVNEKDMYLVYNLAAIMVFPSLMEGFGLPPLEAMRCGIPVVASNIETIQEVAGKAALLVDARDSRLLANGILKLFQNAVLRKTLIENGLRHSDFFSWRKTAEAMIHIFHTIL